MNLDEKISLVAGKIDHAVLNPSDGAKEVINACITAKKYNVASVCVKPSYVELAAKELEGTDITVSTVIGFPHGGTTSDVKFFETKEAIRNGAKEIDMVINIGKLKEGEYAYVQSEIEQIANLVHNKKAILKVIIETALLTDEQKIAACKLADSAGADFVKTSTGFASGGALIEDIRIMKGSMSPKMKIKASGGIKTLDQAIEFINEGCDRLGTSRTEAILSGNEAAGLY